jgi:hypothetical protein
MYIAGAVGAASASTSDKSATTVNPSNNSWHRPGLGTGNLSKRFDAKEKGKEREDSQQPSQVGHNLPYIQQIHNFTQTASKPLGAPDDEAAAMAAMFQAQTANWEETQEKMSQLVSPASAGFLFRSRSAYLIHAIFFFCLCIFPVPFASTITLEGLGSVVEGSHHNTSNTNNNQIGLCLVAMCAIDVVKKVRSATAML